MISNCILNAINNIEQEKQAELNAVQQRITQEKIIPYNQDLDNSMAEALQELTNQQNEEIAKLNEKYEKEKANVVTACNANKEEFAKKTLASESNMIAYKYDKVINELKKQVENCKD